MENDTTTTVLTLFSVRADYIGCEYGSLFIVAAKDASEAEDLVRALLDYSDTTIKQCDPIGIADSRFDDPMIVEQFTT